MKDLQVTVPADTAPTPFLTTIINYLDAGYQSLSIDTPDLRRAELELMTLPQHNDELEAVVTWSCVDGFRVAAISEMGLRRHPDLRVGEPLIEKPPRGVAPDLNPLFALEYMLGNDFPFNSCLVIMRNFSVFFGDVSVAQRWQQANNQQHFSLQMDVPDPRNPRAVQQITRCRVPVILGQNLKMSDAMRTTLTAVEFQLPDMPHMRGLITSTYDSLVTAAQDRYGASAVPPPEPTALERDQIGRILLGLSSNQASDALSLCAVRHHTLLGEDALRTLEHQKSLVLAETAGLRYVPREKIANVDSVGGFELFKHWMQRFRHCYHPNAAELKLDKPKGTVLVGVPGTGKSLIGTVAARMLNMPLVILDVGALFGSLVGESENRMSSALQTIEAMQGAVVLVDEADKLWGGAASSSGDSGVTRRVFGKFLTWLASKDDGSFVIMTMNRVAGLPPEFLRRGRWTQRKLQNSQADGKALKLLEYPKASRTTTQPVTAIVTV